MNNYKKYVLIMMIVFFTTGLGTCFASGAMSYPVSGEVTVTSPFGWRVHPVTGKKRYHDGIDFGTDMNEPVYAAADGTVAMADWCGGYGKLVVVDHGGGVTSRYGHNNEFAVVEGTMVKQGQLVAYSGSTGQSTGPHVHFEIRLNDVVVDPNEYLDGSVPMPTATPFDGENFINSDYDETNMIFDVYYDFAKPIREAIEVFSKQCTLGIKLVQEEIKWLFFTLIVIDLALSATFNLFDDDWKPLEWLFTRFIKYGFILFLIAHWGDIIGNNIRDYFVYMGATAAGTDYATVGKLLSDPTFIVQKGAYIVGPVFSFIAEHGGWKIMLPGNFASVIVAVILAFSILICYFIVGFQIMLAYLEFYVIASLSVTTVGFGGLKQTKFLGEKGMGGLIAVSIKLMIFSFLAVLMSETVKNYGTEAYDYYNYFKILFGSLLFVFVGHRVTKAAEKLLCNNNKGIKL